MKTQPFRSGVFDFSRGIVGGISDLRMGVKHLRKANNVLFLPLRALSLRQGTHNVTSAALPQTAGPPAVDRKVFALARYYGSSPKCFAFCHDGTNGFVYEVTASAWTLQTIPWAAVLNAPIVACMSNNCLVVSQRGGTEKPMYYHPSDGWQTCAYPVPGATLTLTPGNAAGGLMTNAVAPGTSYYYRLRWKFRDGSSRSSTPQQVHLISPNNKVDVTTIPESARTDYAGWVLERTAADGAVDSSYFVVTQTAATGTTSYTDLNADGDLWDRSDEGVHYAPVHFDGVIAHRNRLVGWAGETLYVSQVPGDAESSGQFNFHPKSAYAFPTQDYDSIQRVVRQVDRLVVQKKGSLHALEGYDANSFRQVDLYTGAGPSGPRASAVSGATVYIFTTQRGLLKMGGNQVDEQFGWVEVGHYLNDIDAAAAANVVVHNWKNQLILIAYPGAGQSTNTEVLVYDLRFRTWAHFTGWRMADIVEVLDGYLGESVLFADAASGKVWSAFDGTYLDEKASNLTGGLPIQVYLETPSTDQGDPEAVKDLQRIVLFVVTGAGALNAVVTLDAGRTSSSIPIAVNINAARWGPATKNPLYWGPLGSAVKPSDATDRLSGSSETQIVSGLRLGTNGYSYALKLSGALSSAFTLAGYGVEGLILPQRRKSWV